MPASSKNGFVWKPNQKQTTLLRPGWSNAGREPSCGANAKVGAETGTCLWRCNAEFGANSQINQSHKTCWLGMDPPRLCASLLQGGQQTCPCLGSPMSLLPPSRRAGDARSVQPQQGAVGTGVGAETKAHKPSSIGLLHGRSLAKLILNMGSGTFGFSSVSNVLKASRDPNRLKAATLMTLNDSKQADVASTPVTEVRPTLETSPRDPGPVAVGVAIANADGRRASVLAMVACSAPIVSSSLCTSSAAFRKRCASVSEVVSSQTSVVTVSAAPAMTVNRPAGANASLLCLKNSTFSVLLSTVLTNSLNARTFARA
jgi:hypothetical protein